MKEKIMLGIIGMILLVLIGSAIAFEETQQVTVTVLAVEKMEIFSPMDNEIYDERRISFEIELTEEAESLEYSDNGKRFKRLCRNCDEYGMSRKRTKSFKDGAHELLIRAIFNGEEVEYPIDFIVDSKEPKISKTYPKRGSITNGNDFYIKYTEENLKEVSLYFNPTLILDECNVSGRNIECETEINLSDYDGETISYYFVVEDIAGSIDKTRPIKVEVDTTDPKILNGDDFYEQEGKYIYFDINIDEKNLDEVSLFYDYRGRTKEKRLCSRLRRGVCEKKFRMKDSYSNLRVEVLDEAGNSIGAEVV